MGATQNLSKNLRALRAMRGCSLVHYAKLLNISKSTLQEIEHGHPPHLDTVECISRSLGIPVSLLLSDNFSPGGCDHTLQVLLELEWYASWEPQDREAMVDLCGQIVRLLNKYPPHSWRSGCSL